MKKYEEGTFIFGYYYSAKELNEIQKNPQFDNTIVKATLNLREANENFRKELYNTKLFKFIDNIIRKTIN